MPGIAWSRLNLEPARGLGTRLVEKDRRTARCHAGRPPPVQQGIVLKKPIRITSDILGQCVVVLSADRVLADVAARHQMLAFDTGKYTHETRLLLRCGLSSATLDSFALSSVAPARRPRIVSRETGEAIAVELGRGAGSFERELCRGGGLAARRRLEGPVAIVRVSRRRWCPPAEMREACRYERGPAHVRGACDSLRHDDRPGYCW